MMQQEHIKQLLRSNREQAFRQLYEQCYPKVALQVKRMGGTQEDARDIFQDTLIVFYEKVVQQQLPQVSQVEGYLMGIARHLWLHKCQQAQRLPLAELEEAQIPADFYDASKLQHRISRYLELAGQKCMELLKAFYYHEESLSEISRRFGYRNTRSATVQKFKCLEKVREEVKQKNESYASIVE